MKIELKKFIFNIIQYSWLSEEEKELTREIIQKIQRLTLYIDGDDITIK